MKKILFPLFCLMASTFMNAQPPKSEWLKKIKGQGEGGAYSNSIASDSKGNVYLTGFFSDTIDFDPGIDTFNLIPSGSFNSFISKYDPDGKLIWAKKLDNSQVRSLTLNNKGNIYITGQFYGTVDFDPDTGTYNMSSKGYSDIFILKLDDSGKFIWGKSMGSPSDTFSWIYQFTLTYGDIGLSLSVDGSGNVYTVGSFTGKADFNPGVDSFFLTATGSQDAFVLKLDPKGNFVWAQRMGGNKYAAGFSTQIDRSGDVYTTGHFIGTVDFDPGGGVFNLSADTVKRDIFISKLDASGNLVWAKSLMVGTPIEMNYQDAEATISLDKDDNCYVSGRYRSKVDFDPGDSTFFLNAQSALGLFILKLSTSGNFIWAKSIGGVNAGYVKVNSMTLDNSGNIYTTGIFDKLIDFNPGLDSLFVEAVFEEIFILKLDSSGNFVWVKKMTECNTCHYSSSIVVDPFDNVYITGWESGFILTGYSFIQKLDQYNPDSCAYFIVTLDSFQDNLCISAGFASAHARYGLPPYKYEWNTVPAIKDSYANFKSTGIYSLKVTDYNKCSTSRSILIKSPIFRSGFDLKTFLSADRFLPGRKTNLTVTTVNDGCYPVNGELKIVLDTNVNYNSASPKPDLISGDTLFWNFTGLSNDSKQLRPIINISSDTNLTTGDTVCFDLRITPIIGDSNARNNVKRYCFPVRNSYDPNIKSVYPAGACEESYALKSEVLTYTVQFQNTGTADAIDIYILDSLDPGLDLNTVRVIAKSHERLITEVLPGGVLKFDFRNINLPDSGSDEPGSHGYVIFEVMPKNGIVDGTRVEGQAGIYFDFNDAVMTNSVSNSLVNVVPPCKIPPDPCLNFALYFNAIKDVTCESPGYISARVMNGRPPYSYSWNGGSASFDSTFKPATSGIYSLTLVDANNCKQSRNLLINEPKGATVLDLNSSLVAETFVPNRSIKLRAIGLNDGCKPWSGQFSVVLDNEVFFDHAEPAPNKIIGNTLKWNFNELVYHNSISTEIFVTTSTNVKEGDTLCFDLLMPSIPGEFNDLNNNRKYCYVVQNTSNSNMVSVNPSGACENNYVLKDKALTYTVQFQNTGNAEAIDIYILDSVDSDLDMNTLRVVGQSHQPMVTEVLPGGVVKFNFRNINLPDSNTDVKGSHGYVIYEIMPKAGLPNGTKVTGKAGIYFDFNPPVMTNEVKNTLVSTIPSCNVGIESLPEKLPAIRVYPNPTPGHLTVHLQQSGTVTIYDMVGNLLYEKPCSVGQNHLDISAANGIYLLKANGAGVRLVKVQ